MNLFVAFCFLTDEKSLQLFSLYIRHRDDRSDDRVCADGHSADGIGKIFTFHQLQHSLTHETHPFGAEGDLLAVAVVLGFFAGSENEIAEFERPIEEQLFQFIGIVHGFDPS